MRTLRTLLPGIVMLSFVAVLPTTVAAQADGVEAMEPPVEFSGRLCARLPPPGVKPPSPMSSSGRWVRATSSDARPVEACSDRSSMR